MFCFDAFGLQVCVMANSVLILACLGQKIAEWWSRILGRMMVMGHGGATRMQRQSVAWKRGATTP